MEYQLKSSEIELLISGLEEREKDLIKKKHSALKAMENIQNQKKLLIQQIKKQNNKIQSNDTKEISEKEVSHKKIKKEINETSQNENDIKNKERNKRIFGFLRSTLDKAKSNLDRQKDQLKNMSKMIQESEQKQKEEILKYKQNDFYQLNEKFLIESQNFIKIKYELEQVENELICQKQIQKSLFLSKFIKTIASPPIFWIPAQHNQQSTQLLTQNLQMFEVYFKNFSITSHQQKEKEEIQQVQLRFKQELDKKMKFEIEQLQLDIKNDTLQKYLVEVPI